MFFCACTSQNSVEHTHEYGEWRVASEPTCTKQGLKIRECDCGKRETIILEKFEHKEVTNQDIQPTCLEKGVVGGSYCEYCNIVLSQSKEVDVVDHKYENGACIYCHQAENLSQGIVYKLNDDEQSYSVSRVKLDYIDVENMVITPYYLGLPVTKISGSAFSSTRFKKLTLPYTIEEIGTQAFAYSQIESIVLPKNLKSIGTLAFWDCNKLKEVTFNEGLESIGKAAFINTAITEVILPDSLKTIGECAFYCPIERIHIGKNLNESIIINSAFSIGQDSVYFEGEEFFDSFDIKFPAQISNIQSITVSPESEYFVVIGGMLTNKDMNKVFYAFGYEEADLIMPKRITAINKFCFVNQNVKSLTLGENVTQLDDYSFAYANIGKVTLGKSITKIGRMWFGNADVGEFVFEGEITEISGEAFYYTTGLGIENFVMPKSVTKIGGGAFYGSDIQNVEISPDIEYEGPMHYSNCKNLKRVYINKQVTAGQMFAQTNIEYCEVAEGCTELSNVMFGYSTIGTIVLPESLEIIGSAVFADATITTLIMCNGIKNIAATAFYGASPTKIDTIYFKGAKEEYTQLWKPEFLPNIECVYFYSQTQPTKEGQYWHYDENGVPVKW